MPNPMCGAKRHTNGAMVQGNWDWKAGQISDKWDRYHNGTVLFRAVVVASLTKRIAHQGIEPGIHVLEVLRIPAA